MNKGMFYLLPFLALTQVGASNTLPHMEVAALMNVIEHVNTLKKPKPNVTVLKPISAGRNLSRSCMPRSMKPRAGRNNVSCMKSRWLKKRY